MYRLYPVLMTVAYRGIYWTGSDSGLVPFRSQNVVFTGLLKGHVGGFCDFLFLVLPELSN